MWTVCRRGGHQWSAIIYECSHHALRAVLTRMHSGLDSGTHSCTMCPPFHHPCFMSCCSSRAGTQKSVCMQLQQSLKNNITSLKQIFIQKKKKKENILHQSSVSEGSVSGGIAFHKTKRPPKVKVFDYRVVFAKHWRVSQMCCFFFFSYFLMTKNTI